MCYLIICAIYYLKIKHTNTRTFVVLVNKEYWAYSLTWGREIGTGREEPEMPKFSAEENYSEDSQGGKGKYGQLVGLALGNPHSLYCGAWKWVLWVEQVRVYKPVWQLFCANHWALHSLFSIRFWNPTQDWRPKGLCILWFQTEITPSF